MRLSARAQVELTTMTKLLCSIAMCSKERNFSLYIQPFRRQSNPAARSMLYQTRRYADECSAAYQAKRLPLSRVCSKSATTALSIVRTSCELP